MKETTLFSLFSSFFKIGIMTFGGGYAMLPMLEKECVEKHKWATHDQLLDYFAVGQCTPGVIAVNTATFIGFTTRGIIGSVLATLGIISPSVIIINVLAGLLKAFQNNPYLIKAFSGIRIAVCALILNSLIKMGKKAIKNTEGLIISLLVLAFEILLGLSPIIITIVTITYGLLKLLLKKKENNP